MVLGLVLVNVVAYIIELIAIRAGLLTDYGRPLALVPAEVAEGQLWQVVTTLLMHDPTSPGHLLSNLLFLWVFGTQLEREEGERSVLRTYVVGGLAGSLLTIALGALGLVLGPWAGGVLTLWDRPVVGASGACMAVTFHWLARHYYEVMNFLFIGPIRGRTMMLVLAIIELLNMLSLGAVAWGAHLGGMLAGVVLGFGWWHPRTFTGWLRRRRLGRRGRAIEEQLRVLEGGKSKPQGKQRGDEWIN
jgi:rhomboid protease GluP